MVLFFNCRQTLRASSCSVLEDIKEKAQDYSVIGIDEGQFVSVNNLSYSQEDIHCWNSFTRKNKSVPLHVYILNLMFGVVQKLLLFSQLNCEFLQLYIRNTVSYNCACFTTSRPNCDNFRDTLVYFECRFFVISLIQNWL